MTFFIETQDARNLIVQKLLEENQHKTRPIENISYAKAYDILVFPPNKKFNDSFLEDLPPKTTLVCGNLPENQKGTLISKQICHINVMEDETFAIKNSILTAEGVLANVLEKTQKSIFAQKFLILGTGRSGKAIAKLFSDLNLDFSLSSFDEKNYALAYIFSKRNYFKDEVFDALKDFDVIINTIPAKIFPQKYVKTIKHGALYLEIASIQSIDTAQSLQFDYVLCPALPQKFACITAGEYLFESIIRAIEKTS